MGGKEGGGRKGKRREGRKGKRREGREERGGREERKRAPSSFFPSLLSSPLLLPFLPPSLPPRILSSLPEGGEREGGKGGERWDQGY